jgi:hypothetical protein
MLMTLSALRQVALLVKRDPGAARKCAVEGVGCKESQSLESCDRDGVIPPGTSRPDSALGFVSAPRSYRARIILAAGTK